MMKVGNICPPAVTVVDATLSLRGWVCGGGVESQVLEGSGVYRVGVIREGVQVYGVAGGDAEWG